MEAVRGATFVRSRSGFCSEWFHSLVSKLDRPVGVTAFRMQRADLAPTGRRGIIDSPALWIHARRRHRPGVTWEDVAGELDAAIYGPIDEAIGGWVDGKNLPGRNDLLYPVWRDWWTRPANRAGKVRSDQGPDRAQALRKGVAKVDRLLEAALP